MTDADGVLAARFAATYDPLDTSDWADVFRRAAGTRSQHRKALFVAIAVSVILVPTAIAFRGAIHDLFFGTPAPPVIKRTFATQNKMQALFHKWFVTHHRAAVQLMPLVDPSKADGVIALKTTDGLLFLWAAPTRNGQQCWFIAFARDMVGHPRAYGSGSCEQAKPPPGNIDWGTGWSRAEPTLTVLSGRIYVTNAVAVLANVGRSKPVRLPLVDRYFLAVFPNRTKVSSVVAVDRDGHVVAGLRNH
jgi:hypothetical protein